MEKLAQPGDGRVALHAPPPIFHYIYHHYKVVMYAPAERADTLPLFLLYPYMYSVLVTPEDAVPIQKM
jgi:hypothetical protein